ncbi:MAG: electron transfer flavoprotein subunit beta/FixA family protein [Fimbriimonas sp.]|nr:electron transfer flavoprotein subunit beta/FixA family protein [Fimbriimonas sp.]
MKILVPIKRVVDPYSRVRPLPDGSGIDTTGIKFEINPFDEIALEEAVRLRERIGDVEIVAVSLGTSECEEQLRKALAMGADRAILIETDQLYDPLGIANELAALAQEFQPDIVLMGKQATDDDCNQVGQMVAAILELPQATFASKVETVPGGVRVTRETDEGHETLELNFPCLITTDLRLNEPRYVALPGIIKARSKPLDRRPAVTSSSPKIRTVRVEAPPARQAGRMVTGVSELVAILKDKGVL